MKKYQKITATIAIILALLYIIFEEALKARWTFFENTKIGFVIAIIVVIIGVFIWVVDPLCELFRR